MIICLILPAAFALYQQKFAGLKQKTHKRRASGLVCIILVWYLPDDYAPANAMPTVSDQYAEYSYRINRKDFDEDDLKGYLAYSVEGNMLDDAYSVKILYPVWHVTYDEYDPLTDKVVTKTKKITVFNIRYQSAFLQYQTRIIRTRFKAANLRSYCVKCLDNMFNITCGRR